MAQFKSRVTKRLWRFAALKSTPIWQRNYYEHVIRDEKDLQNKTDYIEANPMLWDEDDETPKTSKRRGDPTRFGIQWNLLHNMILKSSKESWRRVALAGCKNHSDCIRATRPLHESVIMSELDRQL